MHDLLEPECLVYEDLGRLKIFDFKQVDSFEPIKHHLQKDDVTLLKDVPPDCIDDVMRSVASCFELQSSLELNAGFAELYGHRQKLSQYFMTVNRRKDFQITLPHSEGSSFQNIQLVAFYCYENSTDGGHTVLLNVDETNQSSWPHIKERVYKARVVNRLLTRAETAEIKMRYQVELPRDLLVDSDKVLQESPSHLPGVTLYDVLARSRATQSVIAQRECFAYWSSISRFDSQSAHDFVELLKQKNIYKAPPAHVEPLISNDKNIWSSEQSYSKVFKNVLALKLKPGELVLLNNLTWAHGVSNWTPGSGNRKIGAAMA